MSLTPEQLYMQLGALVAEMPDLTQGPITPDVQKWLGRACVMVNLVDPSNVAYSTMIRTACQMLTTPSLREMNAQTIATIVNQTLTEAELNAPARIQGKFITAKSPYDAYSTLGKVFDTAKSNVLLVDAYADHKITEYAMLARENVEVRVLADGQWYKSTLKPAAEKWVQQFGSSRPPLQVRLTPPRSLHDRWILVDNSSAYTIGQSFNALVERSPTSLVRADDDVARDTIAVFSQMWQTATPL
jgi:hypothetical protein